jgi:hypothetical protein
VKSRLAIGERRRRIRKRQLNVGRRRGLLTARLLPAGVAAALLLVPATAGAELSLIGQAQRNVRIETAFDESHGIIPFKHGTKFTIACSFDGKNIRCTEHSGPERCINGRPWILLIDIFPIIKGHVGESLNYGLVQTDNYCK